MANLPDFPSIPAVNAVSDPTVAAILRPMRESMLIVTSALTGSSLPNGSTISTGFNSAIANSSIVTTSTSGSTTSVPSWVTDTSPPPAPTGLTATGAFATIILSWTPAAFTHYAYTEVWSASTNALGAATLIGSTPGNVFSDALGSATTKYYWIRFVSLSGVKGPYNASAGTGATTGTDPTVVINSLTNSITTTQLYSTLATTIATNTTQVNALNGEYTVKVDTNGYVSGFGLANTSNTATPYSTFIIRADAFAIGAPGGTTPAPTLPFIVTTSTTTVNGVSRPAGAYIADAYIGNGTITNAKIGTLAVDDAKISNLTATKITAGSLTTGNYIQSSSYISGSIGWNINSDGTAEFGNITARGSLQAGSATYSGSTVSGSGAALNSNGTFALGNSSANLTFNGSSFNISGAQFQVGTAAASGITMTGSGSIMYPNGYFALGTAASNITNSAAGVFINGFTQNYAALISGGSIASPVTLLTFSVSANNASYPAILNTTGFLSASLASASSAVSCTIDVSFYLTGFGGPVYETVLVIPTFIELGTAKCGCQVAVPLAGAIPATSYTYSVSATATFHDTSFNIVGYGTPFFTRVETTFFQPLI